MLGLGTSTMAGGTLAQGLHNRVVNVADQELCHEYSQWGRMISMIAKGLQECKRHSARGHNVRFERSS